MPSDTTIFIISIFGLTTFGFNNRDNKDGCVRRRIRWLCRTEYKMAMSDGV